MDNHAGNISISNNYIAGIVDAISEVRLDRYFPKGKVMIKPCIKFVFNDFDVLDDLHKWLSCYEINHFIQDNYVTKSLPRKTLTINRYIKCIEFIQRISGYCILKRDLLQMLMEFCLHRLQHVNDSEWSFLNTPFDDFELSAYEDFVNYNIHNKSYIYSNQTLSWFKGYISTTNIVRKEDHFLFTVNDEVIKNNFASLCELYKIDCRVEVNKGKELRKFGKRRKRIVFNLFIGSKLLDVIYNTSETNALDTER